MSEDAEGVVKELERREGWQRYDCAAVDPTFYLSSVLC